MKVFGSMSLETTLAIVIICAVAIRLHLKWSRESVSQGPTLLTTLGIFFCFLGIALGLMDFNTNAVAQSVPMLLNGIKTSFWASVFGIGLALTIKLRVMWRGDPGDSDDAAGEGATVDDIKAELVRLNKAIGNSADSTLLQQFNRLGQEFKQSREEQSKSLESVVATLALLVKAIGGDGDSSLLTQVKLQRADTVDALNGLRRSFEEFAKNVAESNSKALIEALSEVIRDFNQNLTEQFGENFKQLNFAVEKLVLWQVQYEKQLSILIEQETATRVSMEASANSFGQMVESSSSFATTADALRTLMTTLDAQTGNFNRSLEQLSKLVDAAATGMPKIEQKIVAMTEQIAAGVTSNQSVLVNAINESSKAIKTNHEQLTTLLATTLNNANTMLNSHIKQATEDSKKQILALDAALEAELKKSIESLGRQLTALSEKFVSDYVPLTKSLTELLNAVDTRERR